MDRHTLNVLLRRDQDSVPWGFRLQGGANFAAPLTVQTVQPNSIAAIAGLMAGDGVLKINEKNADLMEHEEAKEEILKSGNEVVFMVQRATVTTWAPKVLLTVDQAASSEVTDPSAGVSRISLATNRSTGSQNVGSKFNRVPKPFGSPSPAGPCGVSALGQQQQQQSYESQPPSAGLSVLMTAPPANSSCANTFPQSPNAAALSSTLCKPNGGLLPMRNIIIDHVDDPLPPPPPPLNDATMPLRGVSAAAAAAASDRAVRLAGDRPVSPARFGPGADGGSRGIPSGGRPVSPRSLSPSYQGKVSHARSRSAELLQQYVDAAQDPVPVDSVQQQKSAVLLALEQEEEFKKRGAAADAGRRPSNGAEEEPQLYKGGAVKSRAFRMLEQEIEKGCEVKSLLSQPGPTSAYGVVGFKSVVAPQTKLAAADATDSSGKSEQGPLRCYSCGGIISGVFAKVRGRPIHSDCMRCHRCRLPLKTVGYFMIDENMYCEQHAKEATRPAASGFVPYVVDAPRDVGSDY